MKMLQSYYRYWVLVPLLLLLGYFTNQPFDVNYHDTYVVGETFDLMIYFSLFLFIEGAGYFLLRKGGTIKWMRAAHGWLLILGVLLSVISSYAQLSQSYNPDEPFVEYANIESTIWMVMGFYLGLTLTALSLSVYVINIVISTYRSFKN